MNDDGNNKTTYARITSGIDDYTNTTEDGNLKFENIYNGTTKQVLKLGGHYNSSGWSVWAGEEGTTGFIGFANNTADNNYLKFGSYLTTGNYTTAGFSVGNNAAAGNQQIHMMAQDDITISAGYDGSTTDSGINFQTNNTAETTSTTRMRIDKTGNVGIGTTSPQQKLHVEGSFRFRDGNSSSQRLEGFGWNDNFALVVSGSDALALVGGTPGVRFLDQSANEHLSITESGTNAAQFSAGATPVFVLKDDVGVVMDDNQGIKNHVHSLSNFQIDAGTGINTVDLQGYSKIQNILLDPQFNPPGFLSATSLNVKLPVAVAGMEFIVTLGVTSLNLGNLTLKLIANGSDTIYNGANAVSFISYAKNVGESIHVICFEANKWSVVAHT